MPRGILTTGVQGHGLAFEMPNANHWNSKPQRKQRAISMMSISFTRKRLGTSIQGHTYYKMKNDFQVADVMENISLFAIIDTLIYHARALTAVAYSAAISACFQILKNDHKIPSRFIIMCMLYYLGPLRYMKHILTAIFFCPPADLCSLGVFTT